MKKRKARSSRESYCEFKTNSDQFNPTDKPVKKLLYCDPNDQTFVYETKQIGDNRLAECRSFLEKKARRKGYKKWYRHNLGNSGAMKKFLKQLDEKKDQ